MAISAVMRLVGSAACTSSSGAFVKLAGANAGTAAFLRCALALVVLVPMAVAERRRAGPRPWRLHLTDAAAGVLLGVDYVFWAASVHFVGAGIAAVLINIQVVVFPLLAWCVTRTPLTRRFLFAAPVMLFGVALAGGALGNAEPGSNPVAGVGFGVAAGMAFAGYLFLLRLGGGGAHIVTPVCTSTATATLAAGLLGVAWTGINLALSWQEWGWMVLLALLGQVLAWLLASAALPVLSPNVGAAVLLLQPVLAVALGLVFLGERPTVTQFVGCALVVVAVWQATRVPAQSRAVG
ncbi:drug/metabolite transporter (DMT)-like permease [Lipingzhangella halophila]|uniref:Drug/metabolite transporter (DMT)-like permease n=1 Tax=Lipingzhangella halophila TaxID=1783352 RepID=A0A7W7W1R3_9ACTN|nr:DMT family transporter [Lipingzhangella halophila]MBB4931257.1 drug/metabolite transporter (DMT)-like permease [Lipingzhangella halophila]